MNKKDSFKTYGKHISLRRGWHIRGQLIGAIRKETL